jgi:3-oxoacyl-[acyl-carrier-protein] synthase-3
MQGREVFRHAVEKMSSSLGIACARAGLEPQALDLIVPHQANRRIIDAIVKWASLPEDRVIITVDRHANTSAASIALALDDAWKSGRLKPWQTVGLTALGAGLVWGSIVWRLDGSLVTNPGIVASEGTRGMA